MKKTTRMLKRAALAVVLLSTSFTNGCIDASTLSAVSRVLGGLFTLGGNTEGAGLTNIMGGFANLGEIAERKQEEREAKEAAEGAEDEDSSEDEAGRSGESGKGDGDAADSSSEQTVQSQAGDSGHQTAGDDILYQDQSGAAAGAALPGSDSANAPA